jgi:hypothetical protein
VKGTLSWDEWCDPGRRDASRLLEAGTVFRNWQLISKARSCEEQGASGQSTVDGGPAALRRIHEGFGRLFREEMQRPTAENAAQPALAEPPPEA